MTIAPAVFFIQEIVNLNDHNFTEDGVKDFHGKNQKAHHIYRQGAGSWLPLSFLLHCPIIGIDRLGAEYLGR